MPPDYFPLRWESTGDQWWYASPIDWAAANGHYDIVRELLHLDTNLLIKLTSLRRIRRLETVWDDEEQFDDVAKCRSHVARKLLLECETSKGRNSLIRAGYGGWLLYTAASAGDIDFVKQLLARDPLLVFGEGEYGVTDIFYAAARSKNSEFFRVLLDFSVSGKCSGSTREELELQTEKNSVFRWEMMNRAIHAVARGGDVEMLRELLGDCSDVLVYRDGQGSTLLHTAAGRGQVEVVKHLLASYDILTSRDNQGNTALNIASYRGYLAVVVVLITASLSSTYLTNNFGDTFLHMAVAGFRTPGFRKVDPQIELMRELLSGNFVDIQNIINVRNNDGMTVLHMAVTENLHTDLVELLMSVPSTDLNVCDANGMTPLDLLKQQPRSTSSEILIKRLISAGGFSNCQDHMARSAFAFHLKMQGIGRSPGTSFRIPDAEIVFYSSFEHDSEGSCYPTSIDYGRYSGELSHFDSDAESNSFENRKSGSINKAARHLKILLQWARRKEKKAKRAKLEENNSLESYSIGRRLEDNPIPLRQRFSKLSSMPNNRRVVCVSTSLPSPYSKKKFAAGLMHGVIQVMPQLGIGSPSSPFSESSWSSFKSIDKERSVDVRDVYADPTCLNHSPDVENSQISSKQTSFNRRLMNKYFCFGAQGLALGGSIRSTRLQKSNIH